MATIAFTAAAAGQGAAAYAAAAITGSIIDNWLIMPTLFPPDPVEGQKLGSVSVSGADEGTAVPMVFGQYAVVGGQYVWMSENFTEVSQSQRVGKSGTQVSYRYDIIAANAICYVGEKAGGPTKIASVDQVFFNEKRVYVNAGTTPPTGLTEQGIMVIGQHVIFDTNYNADSKTDTWAKFDSGDVIDLSGFTNAANNDTGDRILDKIEEYTFQFNIGNGFTGSKTLPAWRMQLGKVDEFDTELIGGGPNTHPVGTANTITINGVANAGWADGLWVGQDPEPRLGDHVSNYTPYENEVGESNAPAWSDCAFMPLTRLIVNEFGGRLPSVRYVVSADATLRDTQGIIDHMLLQAGLEATEYDTTAVDNTATVLGFTLNGPTEVAKALQPIMLAQDVIAQERGGTIYFKDRADNVADTTDLLDDFVGATAGDQVAGGRVQIAEVPTEDLPGEVEVTFTDFNDGNLGQGMARAHLMSSDSAERYDTNERRSRISFNFAMTMTESDARQIAWRLLTEANANILTFKFTLPPRYIWLQENDRVNITTGGETYPALIRKVDLGANFLLDIEAQLDVAVEQDYTEWAV